MQVEQIRRRAKLKEGRTNLEKRRASSVLAKPSMLMPVCQKHLLTAAQNMRPSVSAAERQRYKAMYDVILVFVFLLWRVAASSWQVTSFLISWRHRLKINLLFISHIITRMLSALKTSKRRNMKDGRRNYYVDKETKTNIEDAKMNQGTKSNDGESRQTSQLTIITTYRPMTSFLAFCLHSLAEGLMLFGMLNIVCSVWAYLRFFFLNVLSLTS